MRVRLWRGEVEQLESAMRLRLLAICGVPGRVSATADYVSLHRKNKRNWWLGCRRATLGLVGALGVKLMEPQDITKDRHYSARVGNGGQRAGLCMSQDTAPSADTLSRDWRKTACSSGTVVQPTWVRPGASRTMANGGEDEHAAT